MSGPQVKWELVGDTSKSTKAIDEATAKSGTLTGKLQGIGKGMVLGAGIASFNLLTTAVGLGIGKLDEAHQAFLDDQVSSEKLALALKNNIPGWDGNTEGAEAFATAAEQMGFSDDEARDSIGQLVGVTHDLNEAQKLSSLAMDLARAKGIDLATATDIVTKAHEGNGKALKGLGVDIGGAKTAAELLDAVQKNVNGSAAAWAQTNTGKLAVSNQKVQEAMEKVGGVIDQVSQVAIPILADALTGAVDILGAVWKAIQPVISTLANALMPVFRTIAAFIGGQVIPVMIQVSRVVMPGLEAAAKILGAVFGTVFGAIAAVVWTQIAVVTAIVNALKPVLGFLGDAARAAAKVITDAFTAVVSFFSGIGGRIASATRGMWDGIWAAFRSVINTIIRGWNSLQFTVPKVDLGPLGTVGGFSIGTPNIPYLHAGGIVPGAPGQDVPAILQAGERVLPANAAAVGVTVIIEGNVYGDAGISQLADEIARHLRLIGATG